jgi:hypothetical protein
MRTWIRAGAWTVVAVAALDLAGREIVRRALLQALPGATPSPGAVTLAALICAAVAIAAGGPRGRAGLILGAAMVAGLALQLRLGARLQSDGFYYFAYLRSMAFDRDVNFMNDYRLLGLGDKTYLFQPTRTGYAESAWTIGPAIVWSPFFAAGHVAASRLHARGVDVSTDGTSFPYRQAVCVAGLFYGLLGCWFAYRLAHLFFPSALAAFAVGAVVCGSFMAWYLVKEPSMTHAPSMAAVAGFTWLWAATRGRRSPLLWACLGLLAGLMALIRWQNLLFAILPGLDAAAALAGALRRRDAAAVRSIAGVSALFLGCVAIGFLPQMLAWKSIYGTWLARSPVGPQIRWTAPHLGDILWSARNGLFSSTPVLYLAAIGLLIFAVARRDVGVPALLAIALMTYFNACIQDWWGSAGFGGRRFDGTIPLFAIGLASFTDAAARVVRRHATATIAGLLGLLVIWNAALMGAAQAGAVRIGESLPFDRAWSEQARVVHGWFGNPFTYPASLLFAWRNGVSPSAYDLLSTNRFLADPLQPYGRVDIGTDDEWLLGEGWHAVEHDGPATFRWAASPAVLRIPLDRAAPLRIQARLHAFGYPGSPAQAVTFAANPGTRAGAACAPVAVSTGWETAECTLDARAWRAGVNVLELRFRYAQRPMDVGAGADARPLAAAVDWVRVSISPDTAR